ncbi:MAG: GvpL/GvpF family gas vesicle protein [Thermodesulfobacteriota bacterium]
MHSQAKKQTGMKGLYLYAIVAGCQERSLGALGINGTRIYTIANGEIAAVVSDFPNRQIRPERRHFAAHHGVLKKIMEDNDVLPMAFGIISGGPNAVRRILSENREVIESQLNRVSRKVEMGLKVVWDVPNIFEYMVNTHPELMEARDRLKNPLLRHSQDEMIEIGRLFEELLMCDRNRHFVQVEQSLGDRCFEIKRNTCRKEHEVMNLACLVGRHAVAEFEAGVLEAAGLFDDSFAFDYNGPWAPHNFVEIELDI